MRIPCCCGERVWSPFHTTTSGFTILARKVSSPHCLVQRLPGSTHASSRPRGVLLPSVPLWDFLGDTHLVFPLVGGWVKTPKKEDLISTHGHHCGITISISKSLQDVSNALTLPSWKRHTGRELWPFLPSWPPLSRKR